MINTIFKSGLFEGKTVLITGGGTGIGLRTAKEFGQLGAKIMICSRKEENLTAGLQKLKEEGIETSCFVCDIRDEDMVKECVAATIKAFGSLDILINNGGGQFPAPAEMIKPKGWRAVIDTNLTGTFLMCQQAFEQWMIDNGGTIVNVVANNALGMPMMVHTGAARAGVQNMTKTLAIEWGRYGVRINSVAPGTINSSGLDSYDDMYQDFIRGYAKNNQTFRLGNEQEIASAIIFLASPGASFITGTCLWADGGESLYHPVMPPSENNKNPGWKDE